jgi:hypothetical protein
MSNATYFLNQSQYKFLASLLPEPRRKTGRPYQIVYYWVVSCASPALVVAGKTYRPQFVGATTVLVGGDCNSGRNTATSH